MSKRKLRRMQRRRFAIVALSAVVIASFMAAALAPRAQAHGKSMARVKEWDDIPNVSIEVDGHRSQKTISLKSGPVSEITNSVLPDSFPRRQNMKFDSAFVTIGDKRFEVGFVGGRDGKVYYSLKGESKPSKLVVTSVSSKSDVILSFRDETKPLKVNVDVGGNAANVDPRDNYKAIGLGNTVLEAAGDGSEGSFSAAHGSTATFIVEKQIAQRISATAQRGRVSKVDGGDNDAFQTWSYTAPESGENDKITISASGAENSFKVKAKMLMPGETPGGGVQQQGYHNRMFGDTAVTAYLLKGDSVKESDGYPAGGQGDFAHPEKNEVPAVELVSGKKLGASHQVQRDIRGASKNQTLIQNAEEASPRLELSTSFDRAAKRGDTVLIDMVTTRCTPGNQAWAPQMAGITVNGQAIPFVGFNFTLKYGGPNSNEKLSSNVGEWVTLNGRAKGTRVRAVALGAWEHGDAKQVPVLSEWEFHHYIVEIKNPTGPIDVQGIYVTSANPRVVNTGAYGVETHISQEKDEGKPQHAWRSIGVGGSVQAKNMIDPSNSYGKSHIKITPKAGYTLTGATAKQSGKDGESVHSDLKAVKMNATEDGKIYNHYEIVAPTDKDTKYMGYRYFYTEAPLVDYKVSYNANGGTYIDAPVDSKVYNVEGLTSIAVAPQIPQGPGYIFEGYDLIQNGPGKAQATIKTGIKPGESIDIAALKLPYPSSKNQQLEFKAQWSVPQQTGATVNARVDIKLLAGDGNEDASFSQSVMLAKGTEYEFVDIPNVMQHGGVRYTLDSESSKVQSGTAQSEGQTIGTIVYRRFAAGVLSGAKELAGTKRVTGDGAPVLKGGDFSFTITSSTEGAPMPDATTVTNGPDGSFAFGDISFSAAGTYRYEIREVNTGKQNYGYDGEPCSIKVEVTDPKTPGAPFDVRATLENGTDRIFTNVYKKPAAKPVTLSGGKYLSGVKKLVGQGAPALKADQFSFELKAVTPGSPVPKALTVKNDEHGAFSFGDITFTKAGVYEYEILETAGTDRDITYDSTRHRVTVTVGEPETHGEQLSLKVAGPKSLDFKNVYSKQPEYAPGVLDGSKHLSGTKRVTGDGAPALKGGEFTFHISPVTAEAPMPGVVTVHNDAMGTFHFGNITFSEPGTYEYMIVESPEGPDHYRYDEHRAFVTVEVSKPVKVGGELSVTVANIEGGLTFTNTYVKPAPEPGPNPEPPVKPEPPAPEPGPKPGQGPGEGSSAQAPQGGLRPGIPQTGDQADAALLASIAGAALTLVVSGLLIKRNKPMR